MLTGSKEKWEKKKPPKNPTALENKNLQAIKGLHLSTWQQTKANCQVRQRENIYPGLQGRSGEEKESSFYSGDGQIRDSRPYKGNAFRGELDVSPLPSFNTFIKEPFSIFTFCSLIQNQGKSGLI